MKKALMYKTIITVIVATIVMATNIYGALDIKKIDDIQKLEKTQGSQQTSKRIDWVSDKLNTAPKSTLKRNETILEVDRTSDTENKLQKTDPLKSLYKVKEQQNLQAEKIKGLDETRDPIKTIVSEEEEEAYRARKEQAGYESTARTIKDRFDPSSPNNRYLKSRLDIENKSISGQGKSYALFKSAEFIADKMIDLSKSDDPIEKEAAKEIKNAFDSSLGIGRASQDTLNNFLSKEFEPDDPRNVQKLIIQTQNLAEKATDDKDYDKSYLESRKELSNALNNQKNLDSKTINSAIKRSNTKNLTTALKNLQEEQKALPDNEKLIEQRKKLKDALKQLENKTNTIDNASLPSLLKDEIIKLLEISKPTKEAALKDVNYKIRRHESIPDEIKEIENKIEENKIQ